ncbi:ABC-2 family transporter protein [Nocardioides sp. SYSU D00038]|uniref:ABC-2 family transporter protein n=1 Tax=Nocardioides sp. SYSU D00038 TaxID=2812554 RepID=UPI0019683DDA|nr:ABC-2 family transporter protein [Nocardioides sp. SYSU D00038]
MKLFSLGHLVAYSIRLSCVRAISYRRDLIADLALSLIGPASALVGLIMIFSQTDQLGGWSFGEALVLLGMFHVLGGFKAALLDPWLGWFPVIAVRDGALDVFLLRPGSPPVLGMLALIRCAVLVQSAFGAVTATVGLTAAGERVSASSAVLCAVALVVGCFVMFFFAKGLAALSLFAASLQLDVFFGSVWQFGRYPVTVYSDPVRVVLTVVLPVGALSVLPAEFLLGQFRYDHFGISVTVATVVMLVSWSLWRSGIRRYSGVAA